MGITRLTLYEIAGNPDDIVATHSGPDKKTGKYVGWITRGPRHRYKLLISTNPIFDTPKEAKKAMQEIIEWTKNFTEKDLQNPDNPLKKYVISTSASSKNQKKGG